jgi:hypothetical protein
VSRDDEPRWRREARQRQREWDDQPGERDGRPSLATPDEEPATLVTRNRDTATYLLAVGESLLAIQPQPSSYSKEFVFADAEGGARDHLRRYTDGRAMVNARRMTDAGVLLRRLLRDDVTLTQPVRLSGERSSSDGQGSPN